MKPLTKKPWFGPKRLIGWGLSPRTWQGTVVMVIFIAAFMISILFIKDFLARFLTLLALVVSFIFVTILTGGKPGGPKE